jgi:hypothetical protein
MFEKYADCAVEDVLTTKRANSIFEEILLNNASAIAKASTMTEGSKEREMYNNFRRISEKKDNVLAVATWAIFSHEKYGSNKNFDSFERDQLEKHYKTFCLKPHLMDHKMEIGTVRGIIADSHWIPQKEYVQTLIFIDKDGFPKYAHEVESGLVNSFSMGVQVDEAVCSLCGNIAKTANDFCTHIPRYKGLMVPGFDKKCFEFNRGLTFIEQSAVVAPADTNSHTLYILGSVKPNQHSELDRLKKLASILDSYTEQDKTKYFDEYLLFSTITSTLTNRIARELNITL